MEIILTTTYILYKKYYICIYYIFYYIYIEREIEREGEISHETERHTFSCAEHLINKTDVNQLTVFVFL